MGVEFDTLPKLDFPRVKPEAFGTAGCSVGRPGFRVAVFLRCWVRGGDWGGQLVICNGGMWGRVGYSLSHYGKKKKKKGRRRGKGWVELGLSLRRLKGLDVVFQWPIFSS